MFLEGWLVERETNQSLKKENSQALNYNVKSRWPNFALIGLDRGREKQLGKGDWILIIIREGYNEKGEEEGEKEREKEKKQACLKEQYQNHHMVNKEYQWWKF